VHGIVDRDDKHLIRAALLAARAGAMFGLVVCVILLIVGIHYGILPLHPILHKAIIALGAFVISFLPAWTVARFPHRA
jgi:hypothetical protein